MSTVFGKLRFVVSRLVLSLALVAAAGSMTACKGRVNSFIDRVTVTPSDNLETVRIALVFGNTVQSDLAGGFTIKDYGFLFINPFTPAKPFEVGFSLNTSVFTDQDFIGLAPTEVLPNGTPIGIGHALVEIKGKAPISDKFDLYGYVDVLKTSWIGTSAIFNFINDKYFPNGLAVSQSFFRDAEGKPGVKAMVFGPSVSADGTIKRAGGLAVFANVRQLVGQGVIANHGKIIYSRGDSYPVATGTDAERYNKDPNEMLKLEQSLIQAFNQQ